jgi:hypothetical protein
VRPEQYAPPPLFLPVDTEVNGLYGLEVASYFRRSINGRPGIHTRMVVVARFEDGLWRSDTIYQGDSITRPFSLDETGSPWLAALLTAVGVEGEIDVTDDDALTAAMCNRPFIGKVKVSDPKGPSAKRFVNVVKFQALSPEIRAALEGTKKA